MATRIHICVDTMNVIKNLSRKEMESMFTDKGKPMKYDDIIEALKDDLKKGHDYFCSCDNRLPNGRCAGHPIPDADVEPAAGDCAEGVE